MLSFGDTIRSKREAKGWTQKELGQKLYVSDKAISRWENNRSYPDITLLLEIANVLEFDYQELIDITYAIEKNSSHPLANSVCEKFSNNVSKELVFDKIIERPGLGMIAYLDNEVYCVGNSKLLIDNNVIVENDLLDYTKILISKNRELLGMITFEDEIKQDSKELIKKLKEMNIKTVLLSGDNQKVASKLAIELEIDQCFAEALPSDKKDVIENIDTYSLDDIEAKLSIICVRNKVNFNLEDDNDDDFFFE